MYSNGECQSSPAQLCKQHMSTMVSPTVSNYDLTMISGMVYDDAEVLYGEVKKDGEALLEEAFSVLFPNSVPLTSSTRSKSLAGSSRIVAYNTTFFPRWDIIKVPLAKAGSALKAQILQASDDGKEGYAIMHCPAVGPGELKHPSNALHAHLKPVSGMEFASTTCWEILLILFNSLHQWI